MACFYFKFIFVDVSGSFVLCSQRRWVPLHLWLHWEAKVVLCMCKTIDWKAHLWYKSSYPIFSIWKKSHCMHSWLIIAVGYNLVSISVTAEGAENGLEFTIVRPFNWIGPRMDFIPGIDGPSEGVPRVLACFSNVSSIKCINVTSLSYGFFIADVVTVAGWQNLLRREPLKLVDGGESQRTFIYIKDAIEAVLLMIVCSYTLLIICSFSFNFF